LKSDAPTSPRPRAAPPRPRLFPRPRLKLPASYLSPLVSKNYQWGSNADALNRAILLALAHDFTGEARYLDAATKVMNYIQCPSLATRRGH